MMGGGEGGPDGTLLRSHRWEEEEEATRAISSQSQGGLCGSRQELEGGGSGWGGMGGCTHIGMCS